MTTRRDRRDRRTIVLTLVAALVVARLGLRLPPISLSDYTLVEALALGGLAAWPILGTLLTALTMKGRDKGIVQYAIMSTCVVALFAYAAFSPTNFGPEQEVVEAARRCEAARKELGEPIRRRMLGLQGTTRLKDYLKPDRRFDVLVEGSRASGVVESFSRDGKLLRARLAVGDEEIDLLYCTRPTP